MNRDSGAPPPHPSLKLEGRQAWTFDSPATGAQKSNAGPEGPADDVWVIPASSGRVNGLSVAYFLVIEVEPVATGAPAAAGGCAGAAATLGGGLAAT